ncbi:hypothetical protein JKP88DRAFT_311611 [Tribonema minus]|uniref:TLC domain-containing protein n=1 Tax=Tribonema minus TaxID=303371 RepID=A0A835Z8V7_9STRA|nr:hypothetical protein JKP88DRAFT_311611 [Tribonema minus]
MCTKPLEALLKGAPASKMASTVNGSTAATAPVSPAKSASSSASGAAPSGGSSGGSWTAGRGAQLHDDMNLVVLLGMALTSMVAMYTRDRALQYGLTVFAVAYMVTDAAWILCNMRAVKSPRTVLGHHAATLAVLIDPYMHPQHALYTCWALLVEANTFLLIARRRFRWGASALVEAPFVASWVALRLIWYPFLAFFWGLCAFPGLADVYPAAIVRWRLRIEVDLVRLYPASYAAWVGICVFQLWWSAQLFRNYGAKRRAFAGKNTEAKAWCSALSPEACIVHTQTHAGGARRPMVLRAAAAAPACFDGFLVFERCCAKLKLAQRRAAARGSSEPCPLDA